MRSGLRIQEIRLEEPSLVSILAKISSAASKQNSPKWLPTSAEAVQELYNCVVPANVSRMAVEDGVPLGWISAFQINKVVWEIHPLLVDPKTQGKGIGSLLVRETERILHSCGVQTIQLSTSDATNATSLSGIDLYRDPIGELGRLAVRDPVVGHAYQFWIRSGYKVVGVLPDAEGMGIPSICLAKRLVPFQQQ